MIFASRYLELLGQVTSKRSEGIGFMKGTGSGSHHEKQVEVLIGRTKGIAIYQLLQSFRSILSNHYVSDANLTV